MQLFVLVLGFLPMVYLGLRQAGGWGGMKTGFTTVLAGGWAPSGAGAVGTAVLLGVILTAGAGIADFSLLQAAFAAANARAARRAPLIAAAWKAVLPLLLVVPGVIAASLPAPQTAITISNQNDEIVHEIQVVPHAAELGRGLVAAQTDSIADPMAGNVLRDKDGHPLIDFGMAIPGLIPHNLPTGLLGLALAALLACLTGGVAGRVAAFNNVFVNDVYQPHFKKDASEKQLAMAGRLATLGAIVAASLLAVGALHIHSMPDLLDLLALSFAVLLAPMVGTVLLGVLWKRANGCGGFGGLIAGVIAALVHWGLTLPPGYQRGIAGGWISVVHHPSFLRQTAGGALLAMIVSVLVAVVLSLSSKAKPESELSALVYEAAPVTKESLWQRPAVMALLILLLATAVSLGIALV
jgi:SSS family solute:Na+ symporter